MFIAHTYWGMIERIQALFTVIEEGSVNRAATRLHISQPALSRQMKALENEVGGKLLEREPIGVKPTALGHELMKSMRPVLKSYEAALADVRRLSRGLKSELRVGYLISAAQSLLMPALALLRNTAPELKLTLLDLSPKEQIEALQAGEIDVALVGQEGAVAVRDFYSTKLKSMGVCVAVSTTDPLARSESVSLRELKGRDFIGVDEDEMPGRNQWVTSLCRKVGFKPRFIVIIDGITHLLSKVASESAVALFPDYFRDFQHPDIVFVPISDAFAKWDFIVLWQRGNVPANTCVFVQALAETVP